MAQLTTDGDDAGAGSWTTVPDTTDLLFGGNAEDGDATVAFLEYSPDGGVTAIRLPGSEIDLDDPRPNGSSDSNAASLPSLPDGIEVRAVLIGGGADTYLTGTNFS